jgi:hypothetical protein
VSTNIWDEGPVIATLCAAYCDRCAVLRRPPPSKPTRCVQLIDTGHSAITLCTGCWAELTLEIMRQAEAGN